MIKHYQSALLIIFACLLISSCSQDEPFSDQQIPGQEYIRYTADDIPKVVNDLFKSTGFKQSDEKNSANLGYDDVTLNITWDEILMLKDSLGRKAYAFEVKPLANKDPKVFYNLILKYTPDGEVRDPYVMRYTMSDEFFNTYLQTGSLEGFTGKVAKLKLNMPGANGGEYSLNDPSDPDPTFTQECPDNEVTNPSSGGGGPGGDSGGGDTYLVCEYYVHYEYSYTAVCSPDGSDCVYKQFEYYPVYSSSCRYMTMSSADATDCDENEDLPIIRPNLDDLILTDPSFQGTKVECIFEKLKNTNTGFRSMIQKFDGDFPVAHLRFKTAALSPLDAAITSVPDNSALSDDYIIDITFNSNTNSQGHFNFRPSLLSAKTLAHEVIHAEMYRKLMSLAKQGHLDFSGWDIQQQKNYVLSIKDNFPGIYDYMRRYKGWQHEQMAEHYRDVMIDIMKSYGGDTWDDQIYSDLSWEGLKSTSSWSSLSSAEKARIEGVIDTFIKNYNNDQCF